MFQACDVNHDKRISKTEVSSRATDAPTTLIWVWQGVEVAPKRHELGLDCCALTHPHRRYRCVTSSTSSLSMLTWITSMESLTHTMW